MRILRKYSELRQTPSHVEVFDAAILWTTDLGAAFDHQARCLVTQQVSGASAIVSVADQIHGASADVVGFVGVELGQIMSQILHDNIRVVVTFKKPVDGVALFVEAKSQCRHRLARQVVASLGDVEGPSPGDVASIARVEERRDVTASCPRLAYGVCLLEPAARCRHDHAEDAWLTG